MISRRAASDPFYFPLPLRKAFNFPQFPLQCSSPHCKHKSVSASLCGVSFGAFAFRSKNGERPTRIVLNIMLQAPPFSFPQGLLRAAL